MSLFQRAHDIVRAKANKALDAAERPDEMLDLSYEDMLDQITKVKQALVSIAASRKHIELQEQQLRHTVEHLDDAARAALAQGKEDLAREALNRKAAAQQKIAGLPIRDLVTVNGVRLTVEDGTWGLVRASSNKPELVVVVESPVSEARMRDMFKAVDAVLRTHPEVGEYNQTI